MKKQFKQVTLPIAIVLIIAAAWLTSAGNLTPPTGVISATMKTLVDVEPRTAIRNDFVNIIPIVISSAGSYYLAEDVMAIPNMHGIEITANNVTLDLNGFTVYGNTEVGSLNGIHVTGIRNNLVIKNGAVRDFFGDGINTATGDVAHIEGVRATFNGRGIAANAGPSTIKGCIASNNSGDGIVAFSSLISGCVASENGGDGIELFSDCLVTGNLCDNNFGAGIHATGNDNRIDANNMIDNGGGLLVDGAGNLVVRNSVSGGGITVAGGNTVGPTVTSATIAANSNPHANYDF